MDAKKFKSKLIEEKDILEKELASAGRQNPNLPGDWEPMPDDRTSGIADRDEVAVKLESFEDNVAIVRQLEARLAEVKDALERIENGSFGRCTLCGKEIEEDRLLANPAAKTCKAHLR